MTESSGIELGYCFPGLLAIAGFVFIIYLAVRTMIDIARDDPPPTYPTEPTDARKAAMGYWGMKQAQTRWYQDYKRVHGHNPPGGPPPGMF
jgi:hypothetical protein